MPVAPVVVEGRAVGCPGCGLFLHHAPGCSGVRVLFMRYGVTEESAFDFHSVDEAVRHLWYGVEQNYFAPLMIILPDGSMIDGDKLDTLIEACNNAQDR